MIKLLIVEDQLVILEMLAKSLDDYEDISVVGNITTADLALEACKKLHPNIVLMDINTKSDIDGIEATKLIKDYAQDINVILITGFDELRYPMRAIEAGADAFLSKNVSVEELVKDMRLVAQGETIFPKTNNSIILGQTHASLTNRELEVLRLICVGKTRVQVAEQLHVSCSTVNFHINNLLEKTGHHNIIALAMEVASRGYIIEI